MMRKDEDQLLEVKLITKDIVRWTDFSGGLLYYSGDSNLALLNPAIGAASLLLHYAPLASDQSKADGYVVS
jgi:hypothetical protein